MAPLKAFIMFALVQTGLGFSMSASTRHLLRRRAKDTETSKKDCIQMRSTSGVFEVVSDGSTEVCALFLITSPQEVISLEFLDFDIDCADGGLLAVVDGWESQGALFPFDGDQSSDVSGHRYQVFCNEGGVAFGEDDPTSALLSQRFLFSQNVALLQFQIPIQGQGFRVRIDFQANPSPCNVVSMPGSGVLTIENQGHRRNCSVLVVYPEEIRFLQMDVGKSGRFPRPYRKKTASLGLCRNRRDYVEVLGGHGFGENAMIPFLTACRSIARPQGSGSVSAVQVMSSVTIRCPYTMVRLVSSGQFYNSVTFQFDAVSEEDDYASIEPRDGIASSAVYICPAEE